ncbi:MAG: hypothetical protein CMJ98_05770 [Planctomycetes bacterium]|nr:hypothetical protein [Planctomycetota bacterium]HJM58115.1 VCBS repeat-containing protein [Planctomycetota bacterium]
MKAYTRYLLSFCPIGLSVCLASGQDFSAQKTVTVKAGGARCAYPVDLDGDGDLDVVGAADLNDKVAWYENLGAGTWGPEQVITTDADGVQRVFAIDLDGDGDADVLSASFIDDKIAWYENRLNKKTQGFGQQQIITTDAESTSCVFAADLDNDGDADVLSASSTDGKVAWYENDGDGTFGPQQLLIAGAWGVGSVHAEDLDGDGDQDVLMAVFNSDRVSWFENLGGGSFGSEVVITTKAAGPRCVYTEDLDGDGDPDLLTASFWDNKIGWVRNLGGGNFGPLKKIASNPGRPKSVYAADLDGDGDADALSVSYESDTVAWYENLGSGSFSAEKVITNQADFVWSVYAADLDSDGDADVLTAQYYGSKIAWHENFMGVPSCNIVFCDTDGDNQGDVSLSTCDCSNGAITLALSTSFTGEFTYPLVGLGTTAVSPTGVSELCLAGSTIGRYRKDAGAISATGTFSIDLLDAASAPGGGVPSIGGALCNGNTWRFQYWHRDGMNPSRYSKGIAGLIN